MLTERWSETDMAEMLLPRERWEPYPAAGERAAWAALSDTTRSDLVTAGREAAEQQWPALPAHLFLEFVRTGNRRVYETPSFKRRRMCVALVLAECVEGELHFMDAITDALWSLCEESFWGVSAHLHMQQAGRGLPDIAEPIVDLFAAETGALLSWTLYLLGDRLDDVSPLIRERLHHEIERRVLNPCMERNDFWWMGTDARRSLNNWTPWICSNWLTAALLTERDDDRRVAAVYKAATCLDRFLDQCPADGGCDEGPGYWHRAAGSAFDCLELLCQATDGGIDLFSEPLLRRLGAYLYKIHIDADWYVNVADADARPQIDADLVSRFGRAIDDPALQQLGRYAARYGQTDAPKRLPSLGRALPRLFSAHADDQDTATAPYVSHAWFPDVQLMTARCCGGSPEGFFVAVKGGHNAESHNHNDVGNVIVFRDGQPVLVDVGVEGYTARTFSAERYSIWTMRSTYHNLPSFDEFEQVAGRQSTVRCVSAHIDEHQARMSMDLAPAYPDEAGLRRCTRTVTLIRGEAVDITDVFDLATPRTVMLSLLTPCSVRRSPGGLWLLASDSERPAPGMRTRLSILPGETSVSWEHIAVDDARLKTSWPNGLNRILIRLDDIRQGQLSLRLQ